MSNTQTLDRRLLSKNEIEMAYLHETDNLSGKMGTLAVNILASDNPTGHPDFSEFIAIQDYLASVGCKVVLSALFVSG